YIGVSANPKVKPVGVDDINEAVELLRNEIHRRITPPVDVSINVMKTEGVPVIRVQVPRGDDPPYAIDDNKIYLRDETETSLAVRDEIVQLVLRGAGAQHQHNNPQVQSQPVVVEAEPERPALDEGSSDPEFEESDVDAPRTGVE